MLLAGCGYVGVPLPPALDIPVPVADLRAAEYGDQIQVEFTIPNLTTEGLALKSVRAVELSAGPCAPGQCARTYPVPASGPGPVAYQIPARDWVGMDILIAVRATGPKGKTSAWSNAARLSVIAPLQTPAAVQAQSTKDGVAVTWRGGGPHYRIFRAAGDGMPEQLGETDEARYLDASAQFGTQYRYYVMAFAGETQRSVVSDPSAAVTPVDVFPPAVPTGVTAVAGVNTVELAWERNTESDFRGYDVYRSVDNGPFEKVASLIEAPVYTDMQVQSGHMYRYAISAVDLLDNESTRSDVVGVAAP